MNSFTLYNPTRLIFGDNKIDKLAQYLPKDKKILLIYGKGSIKKNGIYENVIAQLNSFNWIEYGGIHSNPEYNFLQKIVQKATEEKIEFILAVGGGSVIDAAKFIASAILYKGDSWDMIQKGGVDIKNALPFSSVLTLPASGSEMNSGAVISRKDTQEKLVFSSNVLFPQFSILDPQVIASLPYRQITNGIIDTFVHIVEQYITYPSNSPIQDGFSETLLKTIIHLAPKIIDNPKDPDLAKQFMLSSTLALNGLIGSGVPQDWTTHIIGHELTVLFDIDHAQTLAILLPGVWEVMLEQKKEKLAQYGRNVWSIDGNDEEVAEQAIEKTEHFFTSLGVMMRITDYSEKCYLAFEIADKFKKRQWAIGEKSNITPEIIEQIIKLRV